MALSLVKDLRYRHIHPVLVLCEAGGRLVNMRLDIAVQTCLLYLTAGNLAEFAAVWSSAPVLVPIYPDLRAEAFIWRRRSYHIESVPFLWQCLSAFLCLSDLYSGLLRCFCADQPAREGR